MMTMSGSISRDIFNLSLAKRFVSDYKLPIPLYSKDWNTFKYYLDLYEDTFGARTKWNRLALFIREKFDDDVSKFLDDYYDRREAVVQFFQNNPAQKDFISMDMKQFAVTDKPKVSKGNVYNGGGDGYVFISVDLKKANFQAMRYVNPGLVNNAKTYKEFIEKFAPDNWYISDSKYLRQVVFGQANPSRQVTVEMFLTDKIWKEWQKVNPQYDTIVSFSNDEFVIKLDKDNPDVPTQELLDNFVKHIHNTLHLEITAECFKLKMMQLFKESSSRPVVTFFIRTNLDKSEEVMCVPLNYRAIVTKLLGDREIEEHDLHFPYEGNDCRFCEEFYLSDQCLLESSDKDEE